MGGRPRIRQSVWEKTLEKATQEGMDPSQVVEDALESYLTKKEGHQA